MKHYIDDAGDVLGFDDNQPVPSGLREITVEEARAAYAAKLEALTSDPEVLRQQQQAARAAAYVAEADPLFFKWQAGEGTKEDWEAKREEIRARYPYPDTGE